MVIRFKLLFFSILIKFLAVSQVDVSSFIDDNLVNNKVIERDAFVASFDTLTNSVSWTIYLHTIEKRNKNVTRTNVFRNDPLLRELNFTDNYYKSGFDRGHLVPAGDLTFDSVAMESSFYYSNISPQDPSFNRGIWKRLEGKVRDWVDLYDSLYIITGSIYSTNYLCFGKDNIPIPDSFYKIIIDKRNNKTISFIIPNKKGDGILKEYAVSIDTLESLLGINFTPFLNESIESLINTENWKWN